jgi:hypothetical protein
MEAFERRDVVVAAAGIVALLVGLVSLILVGLPASITMEPAMVGNGGMGGSGGMGGEPVSTTPMVSPATLALVGAVVAFGHVGRRWWHTDRPDRVSSEPPDSETDRIEAIRSAYERGDLTGAALESGLKREIGGADEGRERDRPIKTIRERTDGEAAAHE